MKHHEQQRVHARTHVVQTLEREGPLTPSELCRGYDPAPIRQAIRQLVEERFVRRTDEETVRYELADWHSQRETAPAIETRERRVADA